GRMGRVGQTTTAPAETPRPCATSAAVRCESWKPSGAVATLAPPELRTTAETMPSVTTWRDQSTGAPTTRFDVKTAAPTWSGPSLTTSTRSGLPEALSPAVTPLARKPRAAVTPGESGLGPVLGSVTGQLLRAAGRGRAERRDVRRASARGVVAGEGGGRGGAGGGAPPRAATGTAVRGRPTATERESEPADRAAPTEQTTC